MAGEVFREEAANVFLGAAVWGTVVVREIEVGDAAIEGPAKNGACFVLIVEMAKVVPATERDFGKQQAGLATAAVGHATVVTRGISGEHDEDVSEGSEGGDANEHGWVGVIEKDPRRVGGEVGKVLHGELFQRRDESLRLAGHLGGIGVGFKLVLA